MGVCLANVVVCRAVVVAVVAVVVVVVVMVSAVVVLWFSDCSVSIVVYKVHQKKHLDLTHVKFENKSNTARSRFLQPFASPDETVILRKLWREQATGCIGLSFNPIPEHNERFARQYCHEPPPEFSLTAPFSGCVHHLSSPNTLS